MVGFGFNIYLFFHLRFLPMIFAFIMFTGCLALLLLIAISSAKVNSKLLITAKELNKTLNYKNLPLVYKIKVNTIRDNYLQIPLPTNTITHKYHYPQIPLHNFY